MKAITKDIIAVFYTKQGEKTGAKIAKGSTFAYVEQSGTWLRLPNNLWVNGGASWQYITLFGEVEPPPPPPPVVTGDLVYIKGYYEVYGMSNPEYRGVLLGKEEVYAGIYGLPAAIKMYNTKQIDIRPDTITRKLWLELFTAAAPQGMNKDTINKRFKGVIKNGVCYTDGAGGTGFNQIITANNMAYSMGRPERKAGKIYHPIRCLKVGSYNSMRAQIAQYPYLVSKATISNRLDDGRGVDPFWHLDGNTVPVPQFCADEVNWIEDKWIQPVTEYVSGYYPPR